MSKNLNHKITNYFCNYVKLVEEKDQRTETTVQENNKNVVIALRQDKINFGIESNELETVLMGDVKKHFDILFENNAKIYLTQHLTFAHGNDARFQSQVKKYFDTNDNKCLYQSAPVKLGARCIVKATSDYRNHAYPSVASIVDFMRFSVKINDMELIRR